MDVDRPPGNGRIPFNQRVAVWGAAGLILAVRYILPLEDYVQAVLSGSAKPLLDFATLLCNYGLTAVMVEAMWPASPISGELVAMLLAAGLAVLNVLEAGRVMSLVVAVGTWRLLWYLVRASVLPPQRPANRPPEPPNDGQGAVEVLEQLGEVRIVSLLVDDVTNTRYLWLNSSPGAASGDDRTDTCYLLRLIPERTNGCRIPLDFVRENRNLTWYTGVQTLAIKAGGDAWRTENLGLRAESLKRLQDALAEALVPKQCSDQPPARITVVNTGPEILKCSAQVITIGVVENGFLVVRREDLNFDMAMTKVLAIRAIYFIQGNHTTGDLNPPAALGELRRFQDSLQKLIYENVLLPFLECTANPPAV